ncbi:MAG: type VI-B CRISPR-associated RNA-guided ribonuclease Cas13b [Prevotellaceae bacterium]|jgi:hypothetical protein|nr:type VI-B CRISPR-associated RNA-guided ribonuclease Cas13b [Prevotellaceae bacterium]
METQISEKRYYDHLSQDDKHYFGGFLNLAKNNISSIAKEFCNRLNYEEKNQENQENQENLILNFLNKKNISYTDWERGVNILKEYLPVISYIDLPKTKREDFTKALQTLFSAISNLRHYYTHYYHKKIELPGELFTLLDEVLLCVIKDVRKQKMKSDKARQLLKESLTSEFEQLVADKKKELIEKKKKNPKVNTTNEHNIANAVLNDTFSHLLYKNKGSSKEELSKYYSARAMENGQALPGIGISLSGLTFLLSIFLGKKEIEQFKSGIKGYKAKVTGGKTEEPVSKKYNSLKFMATHWVFSVLAFKGIKRRIASSFEKETLLMQMVDELSKIPDEVYQTLSGESKNRFLEDINEYVSETGRDDETPSYVVHPVIRKRYESKFSYFAIRFLDEYAGFPTMRFQVYAGQYLHDNRTKEIPGSKLISERMIKEKINVFGKLSEVAEKKNEYFKDHQPPEANGWELFPNPSYSFMENNIHVYIDLSHKSDKAKEIQAHIDKLRNEKILNVERDKRTGKKEIIQSVFGDLLVSHAPTLMLSTNELMAMLYKVLVKKETGAEIENHIVEKIIEKYDLLTGFAPEQKEQHKNDLPKKLLKSEAEERIDYDKLLRAVDEEIKKGNEKLELIERNKAEADKKGKGFSGGKKNKRKYVFYISEKGKEATWIANDLKRFMPASAREQWKGIQHSELQRLISHYEAEYNRAKELIQSVWGRDTGLYWREAFLETFGKNEFAAFYTLYIKRRNDVLIRFSEELKSYRNEPNLLKKLCKDIFVVFGNRFYRINATDKHVEELLAKPFAFSRGLFDDKPTAIPGYNPQENPDMFAEWYVHACSYPPDKFQKFYGMEREYYTWYKAKAEEGKLPALKDRDESYKIQHFKKSCDLEIKKIKFQDVYIKLMVDCLFEKIFKLPPDFDLSRMYDTREEWAENQKKARQQKNRKKGDDSGNKVNENYIWNKTVTVRLSDGKIEDSNVKIKDIGKFRRFEVDPKVKALLSYEPDHGPWSKLELEGELEDKADSYEKIRRKELLKNIQQLEKDILRFNGFDGKNHPESLAKNGNPSFNRYVINGVLKKIAGAAADDAAILDKKIEGIAICEIEQSSELIQKAYLLIYLRNKFAHNQLPGKEQYDLMKKLYPPDITKSSSYSDFFSKIVRRIAEELKHEMDSQQSE